MIIHRYTTNPTNGSPAFFQERLADSDCFSRGVLLDGFPRTRAQAVETKAGSDDQTWNIYDMFLYPNISMYINVLDLGIVLYSVGISCLIIYLYTVCMIPFSDAAA